MVSHWEELSSSASVETMWTLTQAGQVRVRDRGGKYMGDGSQPLLPTRKASTQQFLHTEILPPSVSLSSSPPSPSILQTHHERKEK